MREGWEHMPLSEVARENHDRVTLKPGVAYPMVGVLRDGMGLLMREPFVGGKTTYRQLTPIHPGQLILRSITAWEAPIAVATHDHGGRHVSGVFPVFDLDTSRVLPSFMALICQLPTFWQEMRERSTGSVLRRKTLSADALLQIPIDLPPIQTQQRIVDLLRSAATVHAAAHALDDHSQRALTSWLGHSYQEMATEGTAQLGDLLGLRSGPSWSRGQERSTSMDEALPVVKITNTRPDGVVDMSERLYVTDLPSTTQRLDASSLILIRTNGNRLRIGNVYRATTEVIGHAVSAFQIAAFPKTPADKDFIYWMLRTPQIQGQISAAASGTTGLGNVAISVLRKLLIPWPGGDSRTRIVELAEATSEVQREARSYDERLRQFRSAIAGDLLSGVHDIPEAYDHLLGAS